MSECLNSLSSNSLSIKTVKSDSLISENIKKPSNLSNESSSLKDNNGTILFDNNNSIDYSKNEKLDDYYDNFYN